MIGIRPAGIAAAISRVRRKLKLSQREAGALLRLGENAFDKDERGLAEPGGPTTQLMRVLGRHPELADELRKAYSTPAAARAKA